MLTHLSIQNLAIIESLQLDLNEQMTVLTGETGAGKTIIIDAISLLIGERASKDLIRHHEDQAMIEGIFEIIENEPLRQCLAHFGIVFDHQLVIKRIIRRTGKGQIRLNGALISVNQLRELGQFLVDIHIQHDTHRLFQPEHHFRLIDHLAVNRSIERKKLAYQEALNSYSKIKKTYSDYQNNSVATQTKLDLLLFQKNELEQAKLKVGELEALEEQRTLIANANKLQQTYTQILAVIKDEGGANERLYTALNLTENLTDINQKLSEAFVQISDIYYGLEEYTQVITSQLDQLHYDFAALEDIDFRLNQLQQLKRKYAMEIEEMISYYHQIVAELLELEKAQNTEEELLIILKEAHQDMIEHGEALNDERMFIAKQIKSRLINELQDLQLFNVEFDVAFKRIKTDDFLKGHYQMNGIYEIQFLLSTNQGEPLKPLQKVASGGELSRMMLALKTILNQGQAISMIIFDEIDTGVSGQIANSIGIKMKQMAKQKQVLCITHLPQVASLADHHLHVSKYKKENRTFTKVRSLTDEERNLVVAKMLSGNHLTESARQNAKQLLQN